jgi:hypothetical protein
MILKIYSIYDSAAKAYTQPWFMPNDAVALRAFENNVNDEKGGQIYSNPDQFTLFHIGEWDDEKAEVSKAEVVKSLGNGLEYKKEPYESDLESKIDVLLAKLEDM